MSFTKKSRYQSGEIKVHGLNACLAVFKNRPHDIIKLYLHKSRLKVLQDLIRLCVAKRLAYKIVDEPELEKLAESVHHEGVCLIVRDKPSLAFAEFIKTLAKKENQVLLFLDGVQNPHNVGNILRTCAHFGVKYVLVSDPQFATLPPSARRVSEGGSEFVTLVLLQNTVESLRLLKKSGFAIVATSSHAAESLWQLRSPERCVLVMGSESFGVSKEVLALASVRVAIPGTGFVESLNVASAQAVLLAALVQKKINQ